MKAKRSALYAGGFLGPFAGLLTSSILPELGSSFGIGADAAAVSLMAYLLPFGLTMLVSGHLGGRWGAKRMMTIAYGLFTTAGLVCALAWNWQLFLLAYMLMGISNAFTSPLILSILGQLTNPARLGRTLGVFGAIAAIGQLSAPLFSGLLAQYSWRYAFVCVALVALGLCLTGVPDVRRVTAPPSAPPQRDTNRSRQIVSVCMTNFALGACVTGLGFLIALFAYDSLGSSATERGVILMTGGVAALVLAPISGIAVDRWGSKLVVVACLVVSAGCTMAVPLIGTAPALASLWAGSIAAGQAVTIAINKQVLGWPNAQSAISFVQSFKFFGSGLAPVAFMPIYLAEAAWGFQLAAGMLVVAALLNAVTPLRRAEPESATGN